MIIWFCDVFVKKKLRFKILVLDKMIAKSLIFNPLRNYLASNFDENKTKKSFKS
jgi:hypothetical protein